MKETSLPCTVCGKLTLHRQQTPNHVLHFLISFFTCGLWLLVWLVLATDYRKPWRCSFCGTAQPAAAPAHAVERPKGSPASPKARALQRWAWVSGSLAFLAMVVTATVLSRADALIRTGGNAELARRLNNYATLSLSILVLAGVMAFVFALLANRGGDHA